MPPVVRFDLYREALIDRGWLPEDADFNPTRWYQTHECRTTKDRRLFMRLRALAMKAWDASGVDLLRQIVNHLESARNDSFVHQDGAPLVPGTPEYCLHRARSVVRARNCLYTLVQGQYPQFANYVFELDEAIDESIRLVRGELISRYLAGTIDGSLIAELIAALQQDEGTLHALFAGITELELQEE